MIVTAALCWFDERPEDLERCISSLPGIADRLVAVYGRYADYHLLPVDTAAKQVRLVRRLARNAGLDVEIDGTDRVWAGQVEKRNRLMQLATAGADEDDDWILGVDADHAIVCDDRVSVREELADAYAFSFEVDFYTPLDESRSLQETAAGSWHLELAGRTLRVSAFWRALPGFRVEERHWWYSALVGDRRTWIWGGDSRYPQSPPQRMWSDLVVEHWCLHREERHILANRDFCDRRVAIVEATGQEDVR